MPVDIEDIKSLVLNLYVHRRAHDACSDADTKKELQAKIEIDYNKAWSDVQHENKKYKNACNIVYNENLDKNVEDLVEIFANLVNQAEQRAERQQKKQLDEQNESQPSIELFPPIFIFDFCLHPAIQILAVIFLLIGIAALLTSMMITMGVPIAFISPCVAFPLATSGAVTTTLGGAILACGFFHPVADVDEEEDVISESLQYS